MTGAGLVLASVLLAFMPPYIQTLQEQPLEVKVVTTEDAGFFANSVILLGAHEAMLVDAQLTKSGALKVLEELRKSGKKLTLIYVTHAHADHFLGLDVFEAAYPGVKIIAVPEVARGIRAVYREKLDKWKRLLGRDASTRMIAVSPYDRKVIQFDGVTIDIVRHVDADMRDGTMLWIPSRRTLISGDVTFLDMHVYTPETDRQVRNRWLATLREIRARQPALVIPGHSKVGAVLEGTAAVEFTETYLKIFDEELARSRSAAELIGRMKAKFPTAELLLSVERGAEASFRPR